MGRSLALKTICSTFDSLIETLECLADNSDKTKAVEAIGLLHQVFSFKFLASLIIFDRIFSITKSLSDQLQSKNLDFASATSLVLSNKETLKEFRSNKTWENTNTYIKSVADLLALLNFLRTLVGGRHHLQSKIAFYLSPFVIEIHFHAVILLR